MTIHSLLICPSLSLESGLRTSRARGFALAPSPRDAQNARPFFVPGGFVIPGRTDRCEPGIQTQARCRLWIPGPACGRPGMTKECKRHDAQTNRHQIDPD